MKNVHALGENNTIQIIATTKTDTWLKNNISSVPSDFVLVGDTIVFFYYFNH